MHKQLEENIKDAISKSVDLLNYDSEVMAEMGKAIEAAGKFMLKMNDGEPAELEKALTEMETSSAKAKAMYDNRSAHMNKLKEVLNGLGDTESKENAGGDGKGNGSAEPVR